MWEAGWMCGRESGWEYESADYGSVDGSLGGNLDGESLWECG